ncbi:hypothetical protein BgAZ_102390 [Babesia gibsoni]|uniref:Protein YIPF n=1 Tax=Babesia gibsoni TaxID=33632 RepID=A0AAD8PFH0_BABGI|nr:hypothetical protein BgAZ_102390 [Babesia gibsoni]
MFSSDSQESVTPRLRKDVTKIGEKLLYILTRECYVHRGEKLVKWDFFGPFFISLFLPLVVYFPGSQRDSNAENLAFSLFFTFIWCMAFLCSLNACLIGTYMDYMPFMSIVLYELLPICVASVIGKILPFSLKAVVVISAVCYSLMLSKRTLEGHLIKGKWILVYKPIMFMYSVIGGLVLFNT